MVEKVEALLATEGRARPTPRSASLPRALCPLGVGTKWGAAAAALRMYKVRRHRTGIWVTYERKVCERPQGRGSGVGNRELSENM